MITTTSAKNITHMELNQRCHLISVVLNYNILLIYGLVTQNLHIYQLERLIMAVDFVTLLPTLQLIYSTHALNSTASD